MASLFDSWSGKAQFAGHETFPLRLLWLKKAFDATVGGTPVSVFKDEDAIVKFGVGKNMAVAMRYWATAAGIIEQDGTILRPTEFGARLLAADGFDPYLENISSLWQIHWKFASTPEFTTTTYYAFNALLASEFRSSDLVEALSEIAIEHNWRAAPKTVTNDVTVLLRNYCARDGSGGEDAAEPLLAELGLIRQSNDGGWFEFSVGPKPTLDDGVFALALDDFWDRSHADLSTVTAEQLCYSAGAPGRVFKLDEDSAVRRLMDIEICTEGAYVWVDTAGLRQIQKRKPLDRAKITNQIYFSIHRRSEVA